MRGRLVHRVTPDDVGSRVTVRRVRRDQPSPGPGRVATTDVLGPLVSYDDGVLVVEGRDGRVEIAEADVLASRVVPPAPPPRTRS